MLSLLFKTGISRSLSRGSPSHFMTHRFFWRSTLRFCLLGLCLTGCDDGHNLSQPKPIRPVKILEVKYVEVSPGISLVGDIQAYQQTSLSFRVAGRVIDRRVDVGASVHQGETLATLDASHAKNALKQAQAELDSARAVEQLARVNFERMKRLFPGGAVSRSLYDQSVSDWKTASSRLDNVTAALNDARDNLQQTQLKAPQDGIISETYANQGQVVNAGQPIFKLADNHRLDAVFEVPEQVILARVNQPDITVSLLSDVTLKTPAILRDVMPQADPDTRTYRVRVTLLNPPKQMNLGAIVKGTLQLTSIKQVVIPKRALTRENDHPAVYIVNPVTKALCLQEIQVARFSNESIYVSTGLTAGQRVVIAGVDKLRPGQKVTLMEEGE